MPNRSPMARLLRPTATSARISSSRLVSGQRRRADAPKSRNVVPDAPRDDLADRPGGDPILGGQPLLHDIAAGVARPDRTDTDRGQARTRMTLPLNGRLWPRGMARGGR